VIRYVNIKFSIAAICSLLLLTIISGKTAGAEEQAATKASQKALKQEAALNLWRLNKSVKEEGFYAARIALNIWRSTAIDAGTFDQAKYDALKRQLYEKSVSNSMACFEFFLLEEKYYDAGICLQTWKIHSQELGAFKQSQYESLQERLDAARSQKDLAKKNPAAEEEN
jgi:hypothetical protein